jgi:hypothetical protein
VKLNASDFRHGGFSQDDAARVVTLLDEVGIDLLEISGGTYESPALFGLAEDGPPTGDSPHAEAYFAEFARRARAAAPDMPIMLTGGLRTAAAMESLLGSDTIDVIGMARPLALEPDLPAQLLNGCDGIELPGYHGPELLRSVGESEWYEAQIGRMGNGEDPDPELRPVVAAVSYIAGEVRRGLLEGIARRRAASRAEQAREAAFS